MRARVDMMAKYLTIIMHKGSIFKGLKRRAIKFHKLFLIM